jgi:hypothetical protein
VNKEMKNKDINININPSSSSKKEPIYTQVAKWVTSTIANAKWTKILKVYFVMFFFLATSLIGYFTYNVIQNEEFIAKTSDKMLDDEENTKGNEDLRDFVVTPKVRHDIGVLMYTLDADRVFIFELHNGKKNISGLPFRYVDMSYEVANRENGVDRCYKKYQDVPLNMYVFPTYMYKEKFFVGTADAVEEIDYDFAKSLKEDGGKYVAFIYLNGSDEPLGFLGISFHRSTNLPDDKVIENKMRAYGNTISELLDLNVQLKKQKGGNKK